jgi:hypothetical protein
MWPMPRRRACGARRSQARSAALAARHLGALGKVELQALRVPLESVPCLTPPRNDEERGAAPRRT